jgi:hypothetical protein
MLTLDVQTILDSIPNEDIEGLLIGLFELLERPV